MINNFVSVIIPCFNSDEYIEQTIKSVLKQTYKNYEIILIDDNSSDKTFKIIKRFNKKYKNIKIFKKIKNQGVAEARNLGIKNSRGRYIAFLDSDDLWLKNKLKIQVKHIRKNKLSFLCTSSKIIDSKNNIIGARETLKKIDYNTLFSKTPITTSSVMIDRRNIKNIYFPNIRRRQDIALWARLIKRYGEFSGIKYKLVKYRIRNKSLSRNKLVAAIYTFYVMLFLEKIKFTKFLFLGAKYTTKGIIKRFKNLN